MPKEAHFTSRETTDGTLFDVTPASKPFSFGCIIVCVYGLAAIGVFVALSGLLAGDGGMLFGGLFFAAVIGVPTYLVNRKINEHDRAQVQMLVNMDGIAIGPRIYPTTDIRELILRFPYDAGGSTMTTYHTSTASQLGAGAGMELRNRSYALMARLKSSSKPEILVFGLTYNVGESLLNDVNAALKGRI